MKSLKLLGILSNLIINSCATPPDIPVMTRLGPNKGYYVYTISNNEGVIDDNHPIFINGEKKTWLDIVNESVYLPIYSWIELKKYIIKNCRKNHDCEKEIDSWNRKIESIDKTLEIKNP